MGQGIVGFVNGTWAGTRTLLASISLVTSDPAACIPQSDLIFLAGLPIHHNPEVLRKIKRTHGHGEEGLRRLDLRVRRVQLGGGRGARPATTRSSARSSSRGAAAPRSTARPAPSSARSGCCASPPRAAPTPTASSRSSRRSSRCPSSPTPTSSRRRSGPTTRRSTRPSSTDSSRTGTVRRRAARNSRRNSRRRARILGARNSARASSTPPPRPRRRRALRPEDAPDADLRRPPHQLGQVSRGRGRRARRDRRGAAQDAAEERAPAVGLLAPPLRQRELRGADHVRVRRDASRTARVPRAAAALTPRLPPPTGTTA